MAAEACLRAHFEPALSQALMGVFRVLEPCARERQRGRL